MDKLEIGGYFGLESLISHEYYPDLIAINSTRCALLYLVKAKRWQKVYIPFFLCDSVKNMLLREKIPYEEYRINRAFMPLLRRDIKQDELVYLVNYYGYLTAEMQTEMKKQYGNIAVDNAHAFYTRPVPGIDTLYACRKFFGVPDGAYLSTETKLNKDIPMDISMDRMKHILGRFEGECASDYYRDFVSHEETFENIGLRRMSRLTHNILGAIDYETVKRRREENYQVLSEILGDRNPLKMQCPPGPFAYPFYTKNGMTIKKQLAKKKIYVATLWPNVLEKGLDPETDFAENILPLPCDQRYTMEDMQRVAEILQEYI